MKYLLRILLPVILIAGFSLATYAQEGKVVTAKKHRVQVLAEYPHDVTSYTQGLCFKDGVMWESTGQYGESHLMKLNYKNGKWQRKWKFSRRYFIEGSCWYGENIFILTWMEHTCFVFTLDAKGKLKKVGTASYPSEGWGITTDGKSLIMSDGTSVLRFMDPNSFYCKSTLKVTYNGKPLNNINELEWIEGKIWANIYLTDNIVIIDSETGVVTDVIDCKGLLPDKQKNKATDVLNGIAYNPLDKSIYITGKYWPRLYKVKSPY